VGTILEARNISKVFSGFRAIDDASVAIEEGHVHAIIGPNGAGKTTFFNVLSGFLIPTSGTITFQGQDITPLGPERVARLGLIRSFQITSIFPHLTVLDNVKVSLEAKSELPMRFWSPGSHTDRFNDRAMAILESVGLRSQAHLLAVQLAYGHKRCLELAISIAQDPIVLLLDEPTAGMGTEDVGRITQLIKKTAKGRTVVLVEHNLSVVSELCNRITVLQRGTVMVEGTYDEVRKDQRVIDAYLGGGHA